MSKAILIIDMPESCDKCPLMFRHEEERCCMPEGRNSFTTKPSWCPLKPLHEKDGLQAERNGYINGDIIYTKNKHNNICIDEIVN